VNLEGKAIGLNIASWPRRYHALPADLVRQAIHQLTTKAQAAERTTGNLKTSQPLQLRPSERSSNVWIGEKSKSMSEREEGERDLN
jgi:hypothetical protein